MHGEHWAQCWAHSKHSEHPLSNKIWNCPGHALQCWAVVGSPTPRDWYTGSRFDFSEERKPTYFRTDPISRTSGRASVQGGTRKSQATAWCQDLFPRPSRFQQGVRLAWRPALCCAVATLTVSGPPSSHPWSWAFPKLWGLLASAFNHLVSRSCFSLTTSLEGEGADCRLRNHAGILNL